MDRAMPEMFKGLQHDQTLETNEKYPDRHIQYVFVKDIRDSEGNVVKGCLPSENPTVNQDNIGNQDNVRDSEGTLEKGCLSSEDPAVNQNNIRD